MFDVLKNFIVIVLVSLERGLKVLDLTMVQNSLINFVLLCFNNITLFTKVLVPILLSKMSQFEMLYGHAPSLCHIRE